MTIVTTNSDGAITQAEAREVTEENQESRKESLQEENQYTYHLEYRLRLEELLKKAVKRKASDLHVSAHNAPYLRINGKMVRLQEYFPFDKETVTGMLMSCMSEQQHRRFYQELDIDFSYHLEGYAHFRVNALFEKNDVGIAFRVIPEKPMSLDELGVPGVMKEICMKNQGLILVTGRTGHGKSSTLAGALQYMNEQRDINIITIEEPIEFDFENEKAFIRQREVGVHTKSFASGLKYALRQNPDVIIVGEMRDMETIAIALTAAETGHLVFSTLHTFGAVETINRIIDPFPPEQQQQIRMQLSATLEAVFAQSLIPRTDGEGVVLCSEVMFTNNAVRNIIRDGKIHHLRQVIETTTGSGMVPMEMNLLALCQKNLITVENAILHAVDPVYLRSLFSRYGFL